MKFTKYCLSVCALIFILGGCTTRKSEIIITNDCSAVLQIDFAGNPLTLTPAQSYHQSFFLDELLFFQETKKLSIAYDGFIYLASAKQNITLCPNETKHLVLHNNRAGIEINNLSEVPIAEIRLRPIESSKWSENYLQQPTVAENFSFSVQAEPVDLKLIDTTERVFVLNDTIDLQVGSSAVLFFDSFSLLYAE